jgi:hypothetical protein
MSKKITRVDIPVVNAVAAKLVDIGETLSGAFDRAQIELDENWGCWGQDRAGKQFATDFDPNVRALMVGDGEAPGGTEAAGYASEIGESLRKVADAFAQLDAAAGEYLTFDDA